MAKPRIECVAARDVASFARLEADKLPPDGILPISQSRALAWAANPHAEPEDVALIVARIDGRCAGYLGLLPGRVRIHDRVESLSWLSMLFVPEALRSQAIGGLLLMRAIALGRTLAAIGSSAEAERTYRAIGFAPPREVPYFELDLLRRHNWLGVPLRALRVGLQRGGRAVPGALDSAITACAGLEARSLLPALRALAEHRLGSFHALPLEHLPAEIGKDTAPVSFVRDRALLEWMLEHPWVSTDRAAEPARCFFDDFREASLRRAYALCREPAGTPIGWAILWFDVQGGRRRLHVLDHALDPALAGAALVVTALREAERQRASLVFLPGLCAGALQRLGLGGRLFAEQQRRSFYRPAPSSALRPALDQLELHYTDGDIGFA